jgi:tricorn protease
MAQRPQPPQPPAAPPEAKTQVRTVRMAQYPSLSPDGMTMAFMWRGDIWTAPVWGGAAKRIVEHTAFDARPRWSPDGKTIAFISSRNGNEDVFTVPAQGGEVKQITFHTSADIIGDWSPDGKQILFYSSRESRSPLLYTVNLSDGRVRKLTEDEVTLQSPAFSPDGKTVAYSRGSGTWTRRGYRGSGNAEIYTLSLTEKNAVPKKLTDFKGNDFWPLYSADGKTLYFVTDRDGTFNLWKMTSDGRNPRQVTHHKGDAVHYPAISFNRKRIVYECGFDLWTLSLEEPVTPPRKVNVTAEIKEAPKNLESLTLTSGANEFEVSPDGQWAAFVVQGEIFMVPTDKGGDAIRLTNCPARDFDFWWSPDSKKIAYVCENDGDQNLCVVDVQTKESQRLTTTPGPETSPHYSPNGKWIAYIGGSGARAIYVVPAAGGAPRLVTEGPFISDIEWSHDSRWIAYAKRDLANSTDVWVVPETGGKGTNITRYAGTNASPKWTADGKKIIYLASHVDSGATRFGGLTGSGPEIWAVSLTKPNGSRATSSNAPSVPPTPTNAASEVSIDFEGIQKRAQRVPMGGGGRFAPGGAGGQTPFNLLPSATSDFVLSPDGKTIYLLSGGNLSSVPVDGGSSTQIASGLGVGALRITADGSAIYVGGGLGGGFGGGRGGPGLGGGIRKVVLSSKQSSTLSYTAKMELDRDEERRQTFDEGWRLLKDNFYDENMHGADWNAVRKKYRPIVDECGTPDEFFMLMQLMVGELNASHLGVGPAGAFARGGSGPATGTGYLGVTFDDHYEGVGLRVSDVMPDSPADKDETRINAGEYVLTVNGKDATLSESLYQTLKAGTTVELLVSKTPSKDGARAVKITPIGQGPWRDLEYERWINANRQTVEKLSNGRLTYMHIKAMDPTALARFQKELLSEAYDKDGLVLDVRWNPGGRIHDELFAILTRRVHSYETPRGGLKMTQPFSAFTRPMILLINQGSASDAEIFPHGFRVNKLGKLVGVPTAGAVIGTNNRTLQDRRTDFRVPQTGWTTPEGLNLENYGVPPDVYVENLPEDYLQRRDRQLEVAVQELLKQMEGGKSKRQK